ncbi:hypothetical protein PAXRUDRAFT_159208 [Paxillus rubicundulus Ve08.2h10]|uniref:Unplaced genomic scaffold scaffold_1248, whole genome shotgun sequence n=1 Tax=Paxillus rubicundulus Ve08.2h10 TaxID=930991 RepID=A0A0D0CXC6_9AGAM|nr:hypothetical protein PAXRUDRAFT_159208 [Paxillus rubicundulus Ve08.2h10]
MEINASAQESTTSAQHSLLQLCTAEWDLENIVEDLIQCKQIIGTVLTLEEMLNPVDEREVGESTYQFKHGDGEIIAKVNHEMAVR